MKKILIFITTLLFLQGCNVKDEFSKEQLQNLTNSVVINQLEKTEFNIKENKLSVFTNDEVINQESFEQLLSTLKINDLSGEQISVISELTASRFDNKNFNIEITTKNNNSVSFNVSDTNSKTYDIINNKYSAEYVKVMLTLLSKELMTFNELAGTIETDLSKGRELGDKVKKFNETQHKIVYQINSLKNLTKENTEFSDLDNVNSKIARLEILTKGVISAVDSSIDSKNSSAIGASFLYINDIDKIARELP